MPTAPTSEFSSHVFRLDAAHDHVVLAVNPKAGARCTRHLIEELADRLHARKYVAEILTDLDEISARTHELLAAGRLRTLVGAGGDGTAHELVNRTRPGVPLTMFPSGTENLLAKYIGMKRDPAAVCEAIADGHAVRLDAGYACSPSDPKNGRVFLLMADCGFDAEVVRLLHDERDGHISRFTYFKPFVRALRNYQHPEMRVECDPESGDGNWRAGSVSARSNVNTGATASGNGLSAKPPKLSRWVFVFNLPCYAQGLRIAPQAVGTDGLLDVCLLRGGSPWHVFKYLFGALFRCHTKFKDCETTRVRRMRIEADQPTPYLLDGDPGGMLPLDIELLPERLTLVVPRAWLEKMSLVGYTE